MYFVIHILGIMSFTCDRCKKVLTTKQGLQRHENICTGIHPLECKYCFKFLSNIKTKYKHSLICKFNPKNNPEENPVDRHLEHIDDSISNSQTINNNTTNNNITNNNTTNYNTTNNNTTNNNITHNNITNNTTINNNYINLVKFESNKNHYTQLISPNIAIDEVKALLNHYCDLRNKYSHLDILRMYSHKLFDIPENRCVKKTNLNSKYSKVHLGNNQWSTIPDRNVYDKLVMDTTRTFIDNLNRVDEEKSIHIQKNIQDKINNIRHKTDHLQYCFYDDHEKEYIKEKNIASEDMKCLIFDITPLKI